ncbi:unnamed protein product [Adineta steineri]|uniref:Fungal lipase-like domain-containing protein n=1 Tax=Adineta steineri TaxID=433720 RepID=A0A819JIU0_9BILA|nr:unnamed protein product [Adineta steineri]CAF0747246.1 unnamed protein product [Adineta steineri]CAF0781215.1 unnamed protein product [Adineta steineri]CAF3934197.1 unnamed protein product [Adineta steineri]CAF3958037.1 unnamed protein product [Adineta steineri]
MAESKDVNKTFPHIPFNYSSSFHSTVEGKVWTRLLIHLCWWLHDMYEIDGTGSNAKFEYFEEKISQCQTLFPGEFKLMFSDPDVSPNEQHPLLFCRQDEQKIIIIVFRATVSSKSLQDVFTDISIHSNHDVYLGSRHSGFSERAESSPLLAVTNWLRRGWKVVITGHSLGGAVSQLFTAQVINNLVEAGLLPEMVSLRCVTFGTPQCADYRFWSSYTRWYDVFDTYIYEHDAIFRLVTFGTDFTKKIIGSFAGYLKAGAKICAHAIGYRNQDQTNILTNATDQVCEFTNDVLVPKYSIFGRHHFIRKGEKGEFKIDSIGEQEKEKERLLKDLGAGHRWYDYFIEERLIPEQFKFIFREFMEHGCYPFSISQLFNEEATPRLGTEHLRKQQLLRIKKAQNNPKKCNWTSDSVPHLSAIMNDNGVTGLSRIHFQGFLVDFVISVELPSELVEPGQTKTKKPVLSQDKPDECAILCFNSDVSINYLKKKPWFEVNVKTYFGQFNVQVVVISNFDGTVPSVYQLDPISTILRAFIEFILDANSIEQIDSSLTHCFSSFFTTVERIDSNKYDTILARYLAELQSRNLSSETDNELQNLSLPERSDKLGKYFEPILTSLQKIAEENKNSEKEKHALFIYNALKCEINRENGQSPSNDKNSAEYYKLVPLHLKFGELHQYLRDLHKDPQIVTVRENLKVLMAPAFYTMLKIRRLEYIEFIPVIEKLSEGLLESTVLLYIADKLDAKDWVVAVTMGLCAVKTTIHCITPSYRNIIRSLTKVAHALLKSTGEHIDEKSNDWAILNRIPECQWSRRLIQARLSPQLDTVWNDVVTNQPLRRIPSENRCQIIDVIEICCQLCSMREILAGKPPKVVITGQSQTGKSTLFEHLTGRELPEISDVGNFNTRVSLQAQAFIKLNDKASDDTASGDSVLPIDLVDSPGYDDATGQAGNLLGMSFNAANLFIVVTTLRDVNQTHTIALLNKLLNHTKVKILVLINQVDIRLKEEWDRIRRQSHRRRMDSDEDSDMDETNQEFNRCQKLDQMVERPRQELIEGLTIAPEVIKSRVTFQTIILKGFNGFNKAFIKSNNAYKNDDFRDKVHRSNVNNWIKKNLINSSG